MVLRLWHGGLAALACLAGAILAGMFLSIVADVTLRSLGRQPPLWTPTFVEFGLLYATMLAAPWLAARDGHIRVRALTDRLPARALRAVEAGMFATLTGLCLLLAWYALDVTLDSARRGEVEYRSVILPRWTLFAPIAPAFLLMAVEFARLGLGGARDRDGARDAERSL